MQPIRGMFILSIFFLAKISFLWIIHVNAKFFIIM